MQLILYYAPNACSLVPYVALTEAGAPFEVRPLNFRKSQHMAPEYFQLNPKHKRPPGAAQRSGRARSSS
jgi:glutathione S-transferase